MRPNPLSVCAAGRDLRAWKIQRLSYLKADGKRLIATMAALVLSLLIASANSAHDAQIDELKTASANIVLLDRTLEFYGPGAKGARDAG